MKKLLALCLTALLFSLQACAVEQWQEGTHFNVISDETTEKPEVIEVFSFWCPACYQFEPLVAEVKRRLDPGVTFTKVHANFMGFTGPNVQDDATRAMLIARTLGKEDALNGAIFSYIHRQRAPVTGLADLRSVYAINDVDTAEFDKLASSFGINSQLQKNNQILQKYREHLKGVPSFIINGKYQPTFTRDMTPDDMINLIIWLTKQP